MTHKRFLKFCVVGAANTIIDFCVFAVLFYNFSVPIIPAHIAGFSLAVVNSYIMNKLWTFSGARGHDKTSIEFMLFILTVLIGLGLSTFVIWVLAPIFHPLIAKAATIIVSLGWNFTISHMYVFKTHRS